MPHIRKATQVDHDQIFKVWLNSVRASHHFLTEADIESLIPVVQNDALPNLEEIWVICDAQDQIVGFMGLEGASLEALFIAPSYFRRGGGRLLVEHARQLKGPLVVSVNEQNPEAIKFYTANGFEVIGRSPTDDAGRPFPLLHMRETTTAKK